MNARQHREAFRAAVADGRECRCIFDGCFFRASNPCPLCTTDFIQDHPCPAGCPSIYYISGDTPVVMHGENTVLVWVVIRYGQCACLSDKCTPADCPPCNATSGSRCPRGRHVKLRAHEKTLREGYASGELSCPHGNGGSCTTDDSRWYHGDCAPSRKQPTEVSEMVQALLDGGMTGIEFAARAQKYRQGRTFACAHHGAHPHGELICARCPACLAIDPRGAMNAAHDYSDLMIAPETVENLHAEIARLRARVTELEGGNAAGER